MLSHIKFYIMKFVSIKLARTFCPLNEVLIIGVYKKSILKNANIHNSKTDHHGLVLPHIVCFLTYEKSTLFFTLSLMSVTKHLRGYQ